MTQLSCGLCCVNMNIFCVLFLVLFAQKCVSEGDILELIEQQTDAVKQLVADKLARSDQPTAEIPQNLQFKLCDHQNYRSLPDDISDNVQETSQTKEDIEDTPTTSAPTTASEKPLIDAGFDGKNFYYLYNVPLNSPALYAQNQHLPLTRTGIPRRPAIHTAMNIPPTSVQPGLKVEYKPIDETVYRYQMKFVLPMLFPKDGIKYDPTKFDQFAYYPKHLQPSTINIQYPYTPQYFMIRSVKIPDLKAQNEKN